MDGDTPIQDGKLAGLLPPAYWLDVLAERDLYAPGVVLLSGTIPILPGVNQFADRWRVELGDPATGATIDLAYQVRRLPDAIG